MKTFAPYETSQVPRHTLFAFCFVLLLTPVCIPQDSKASKIPEQADFGVEGAFQRPVVMPTRALQTLRTSKPTHPLLQLCAEQESILTAEIPASWFVASEIRLTTKRASGLVVRGEHQCLAGAHITQFWVLEKLETGYRVVFQGRGDGLSVLPTRTHGYRDLELVIITQAGAVIDDVALHFSKRGYIVSGHRIEHNK
jgi:hypothetical protein